MLESESDIYQLFSTSRPGLQLLSVEPAAIPVTVPTVTVLAQEKKPLPLVDEFTLRCSAAGLADVDSIARFLGLDTEIVLKSVAAHIANGLLAYKSVTKQFRLTPTGVGICRDLAVSQPVEAVINPPFDRMTWSIANYPNEDLIKKGVAESEGRHLLKARQRTELVPADISLATLNKALEGKRPGGESLELFKVLSVKRPIYKYMRAWLLIYCDPRRPESPEFSIVVNGHESKTHEEVFQKMDGKKEVPFSIDPQGPPAPLPDGLEKLRDVVRDVPSLLAVETAMVSILEPETPVQVNSISMFEHRILLTKALETAQKRLLLLSPWVKGGVVNTDFLQLLEQRLRAKVKVHIGHGYGPDDSGSDAHALTKLANLQRRYPDLLTIVRLANTHAKVLIFDDCWISTSFNWLSFKGDPNRTYRMEEGTLVLGHAIVDKEYEKYLGVLNAG